MAKVIACVIAYDEQELLPGCLDSLQGRAGQIVVVDGRYLDFPGEGGPSTDKTCEVALSYPGVLLIPSPQEGWVNEIAKRNAYLIGSEGDWYFLIDADEVLLTPLPRPEQLPPDVPSWQVRITMLGTRSETYMVRLVQHRGRMAYRYCLDAIFSDDVLVGSRQNTPKLPSVQLYHRQPLRPAHRRADKQVYCQRMWQLEGEMRLELGM